MSYRIIASCWKNHRIKLGKASKIKYNPLLCYKENFDLWPPVFHFVGEESCRMWAHGMGNWNSGWNWKLRPSLKFGELHKSGKSLLVWDVMMRNRKVHRCILPTEKQSHLYLLVKKAYREAGRDWSPFQGISSPVINSIVEMHHSV